MVVDRIAAACKCVWGIAVADGALATMVGCKNLMVAAACMKEMVLEIAVQRIADFGTQIPLEVLTGTLISEC